MQELHIPIARVVCTEPYEGDVSWLETSIKEVGRMLHPITVRENGNQFKLLAGAKRLQAMKNLQLSETIYALVFPEDMDEDLAREISLHENLKRDNLPWYDIAEKELELHELRQKQHGGPLKRGRGGRIDESAEGWGIVDTAKELQKSLGAVSQDLNLALAIRSNPHLKTVKDKTTAIKLVKEVAKREQAIQESQVEASIEMNQILCGNSLDILKHFPDNTFDACITDPPWLEYKDARLTRDDSTIAVFKEVFRVLKPDAFLYAVMSTQDFFTYLEELPKFGFTVQKYPLLWKKNKTITHGRRSWEYARDYEPILLAAKGSPVLTVAGEISSIYETDAVPSAKLTHPHEKPISFIQQILAHCSYRGSKILDPFAGSGATLDACKQSGRQYIGIERDHKFYQQIERRLKG